MQGRGGRELPLVVRVGVGKVDGVEGRLVVWVRRAHAWVFL